jgi:hypothetical protein
LEKKNKGTIPKESKKITLHPLSFDDALSKLLSAKPEVKKKKKKDEKNKTSND